MLEITSPGSGDKAILRYWVARGYPSNVALDGKIPFESGVVLDCEEGSIKFANGDFYKGSVNCDLEFGEYPIVKPDGYGVLTRADGTTVEGNFQLGVFCTEFAPGQIADCGERDCRYGNQIRYAFNTDCVHYFDCFDCGRVTFSKFTEPTDRCPRCASKNYIWKEDSVNSALCTSCLLSTVSTVRKIGGITTTEENAL
jgi:hypothetical protein